MLNVFMVAKYEQNHRIIQQFGIERILKGHIVLTLLPRAVTPSTRARWSKMEWENNGKK